MSQIRPDQSLRPSLLDRLIDHEPDVKREPARSRGVLVRDLKASVCADLRNLLNTRARCVPPPAELKELRTSLVSYGLPDLAGASLATPRERAAFCRMVQAVIGQFDRRLRKLAVRPIDTQDEPLDRTIRFQIDAVLEAEPTPEPLVFDSAVQLPTGAVEVGGESHE
jgi:type VI secretion system protein ImpF